MLGGGVFGCVGLAAPVGGLVASWGAEAAGACRAGVGEQAFDAEEDESAAALAGQSGAGVTVTVGWQGTASRIVVPWVGVGVAGGLGQAGAGVGLARWALSLARLWLRFIKAHSLRAGCRPRRRNRRQPRLVLWSAKTGSTVWERLA